MGNPDKIVAVGLGEVLYDHDVVTDEYTFGGAPANFADHFLKCSRLISGPDAAEVHVVSAVGDDERGRAVSAELEAAGFATGFAASGSCLLASSTNAGMPPGSTPTRFCRRMGCNDVVGCAGPAGRPDRCGLLRFAGASAARRRTLPSSGFSTG